MMQLILIVLTKREEFYVVINPYSSHHDIMKLIILRLGAANKSSLISESVMEIRINNQPCRGINLTTRHTLAQRAPQVATIHDEVKDTIRAHHTLVHVFHAYASTDTPWVAHALSHFTSVRYGRITSVSAAYDATQFRDSICPVCVSTFKCLFIWTQLIWALIDTGGGYHLKLRILDQITPIPYHPVFFTFS
jgi:hypothetical protein